MSLKSWPTRIDSPCLTKVESEALVQRHAKAISDLQERLYASRKYAVLIILQGMDTSGKDGVIRHVMSGINPQGCKVASFKPPTEVEELHDFLWRSAVALPERGEIGIFNRSYYEETLVVRVHPEALAAEGVNPNEADLAKFWRQRFHSINNFEAHLHRNGTRIVKIFLHLSKQEQRHRLLARIDDPTKNWKLSRSDIVERRFWDAYQKAYEDCISGSGSRHCPWYIVPADDKQTARLIVSQIIFDVMERLDLTFPALVDERKDELGQFREELSG